MLVSSQAQMQPCLYPAMLTLIQAVLKPTGYIQRIICNVYSQYPCATMAKFTLLLLLLGFASGGMAAPAAELWPVWQNHADRETVRIDHSAWWHFLQHYLVKTSDSINRVDYAGVSAQDKTNLQDYLDALQQLPVSRLTRAQQRAYWINLYNAGTVKLILEHYPVQSILDIDISPGWFSNGPWDSKLYNIEGRPVSLNDIEHRILRPIWQDPRIHYALNCASLGCPNLQPEPFTAEHSEQMLEQAARAFVNHPRGVHIEDAELVVSSIYHWFKADFGGSDQGVIDHLGRFAEAGLAARLGKLHKISGHQYDWSLNDSGE